MLEQIRLLFDTSDFPARWTCGYWTQVHGWTHIVSDTLIFGAYGAIPTAIAFFVIRRGSEVPFPKLYWLFAAFIFSCGFGHLVEASLFWQPWYRFSATVKIITAVVSWATVFALIKYVPHALSLPAVSRLNRDLQREIADRRLAEARVGQLNHELAMRVQELEKLLAMLPVGIGIAIDRECRTIRTNRAFSRMLGIGPEENASLSAAPDQAPTAFSIWRDGRKLNPDELPIQRAAAEGAEILNFEEMIVREDGRHLDLLCDAAPIFDENHICRGAVGVFHDITDRKQAEERFRLVVEASPNALLMTDEQGRITLVNTQAERIFGFLRSELLGMRLEQLLMEDSRASYAEARNSLHSSSLQSPLGTNRELNGLRKDSRGFPLELGLRSLVTSNGSNVLASIIDITDRKRTEEKLLGSLAEKQALLHEIHHRVKNNLQFIISLLRLQAVEVTDPKLVEVLEETRTRVHAMSLVHERMYRAEDFSKLDYASYLRELVAALSRSMSQRVARINLTVQADPVELGTNAAVPVGFIVNELVSNSLRHAFPEGTAGKIEIHLHGNPKAGYDLVVRDDGSGTPSDFDPLATPTMGWRLVAMLVRQIGGTMVMSRDNGTEYAIHFTPRLNV